MISEGGKGKGEEADEPCNKSFWWDENTNVLILRQCNANETQTWSEPFTRQGGVCLGKTIWKLSYYLHMNSFRTCTSYLVGVTLLPHWGTASREAEAVEWLCRLGAFFDMWISQMNFLNYYVEVTVIKTLVKQLPRKHIESKRQSILTLKHQWSERQIGGKGSQRIIISKRSFVILKVKANENIYIKPLSKLFSTSF